MKQKRKTSKKVKYHGIAKLLERLFLKNVTHHFERACWLNSKDQYGNPKHPVHCESTEKLGQTQ